MRDSVPFPTIPSEWHTEKLVELSDFITKGTTPTTIGLSWATEGILFLRSECVGESGFQLSGSQYIDEEAHAALGRSTVQPGDLLVTITGNVGRVCMYPAHLGEANINQHIARIRIAAKDRADPRFLSFVLSAGDYRKNFERIVTGLAYPQLSLAQVRETVVPIPSLPEQRKIAAILSSVDDAIESAQAVIDQLGVVKKAMMAELLTRGLPGRHTKFKQTEIGEVPETWDVRPLVSLIAEDSTITYGVVQPGIAETGGVLFIRSGDVAARHLTPSSLRTISREVSAQFARTVLRGGELLIALVGQPGAVVVAPQSLAGANIARQVGLVRLSEKVGVEFARLYLESESGRRGLLKETLGSVQQVINLRDLEKVLIAIPSVEEQARIVASLCGIEGRVKAEIELLAELRSVKSALMSVLLTGEVRVTPDESTP